MKKLTPNGIGHSFKLANMTILAITVAGLLGCVQESSVKQESLARSSVQEPADSVVTNTRFTPTTSTPATYSSTKRRIALVIGNASYVNIPALRNPINDARAIAQTLRQLGFDVNEQENVSDQRTMRELIAHFADKLRSGGGLGLFYYSGHGIQINGENYLIPVNANLRTEADVDYEVMAAKYVQTALNTAQNGANVIILDACRNNPFTRSMRRSSKNVEISSGLASMEGVSGSLVAYSTSPGLTADDGDTDNGTYTKHLLKHIVTPGISIEEMFKRVRIGMNDETHGRQVPWELSSLVGNFCFADCTNPEVAQAVAEAARLKVELQRQQVIAAAAAKAAAAHPPEELERLRLDAEKYRQQAEQNKIDAELARKNRLATEQALAQREKELQRQHDVETELAKLRAEAENLRHQAEQAQQKQMAAEQSITQHSKDADKNTQHQQATEMEMSRLRAEAENFRQQAEANRVASEQLRQKQEAMEQATKEQANTQQPSHDIEAELNRLRADAEKYRRQAEANKAAEEQAQQLRIAAEKSAAQREKDMQHQRDAEAELNRLRMETENARRQAEEKRAAVHMSMPLGL